MPTLKSEHVEMPTLKSQYVENTDAQVKKKKSRKKMMLCSIQEHQYKKIHRDCMQGLVPVNAIKTQGNENNDEENSPSRIHSHANTNNKLTNEHL